MDHEKVKTFVEKYMCKYCYSVRIESNCNRCGVNLCKGVECSNKYIIDYQEYLCNNCWVITKHQNDGL